MKIILDRNNIYEYLTSIDFTSTSGQISVINAKNLNILIEVADDRYLLVKQEIHDDCNESEGEFWAAWRIDRLVKQFPEFDAKISTFLPRILHFDPENSILIVEYVRDYIDLYQYYLQERQFPIAIPKAIGHLLATIHAQTFDRLDYQHFLDPDSNRLEWQGQTDLRESGELDTSYTAIDIIERLGRITPQVFATMPLECLQFFRLYQRFPSLTQAIADLGRSIVPSCLIHNDLKLNNILLDLGWQSPESQIIKLIDWERASWGDPAFDLGCILGSYLEIWLDGLAISNILSIDESLQLAATPLELLQPSLFSLVRSYLDTFPAIVIIRPDYLTRSIQFAGLALIQRIEITIDEQQRFGDRGIVMLQVAKQLLCTPQAAMKTLFAHDFTRSVAK
ncbi:phosphotransferase [Chamaesiphon sp. OTE_8_metabat_110]|uniref:phosphotransferase n=1 Tax=Chamaesiphon sp. OTE_8_metabat_110 TaxID=2964696 RepID=UPI00286BF6DE|nr:phosphotransferase [Chamaesiphon sp. OTE_8_metabat_110]